MVSWEAVHSSSLIDGGLGAAPGGGESTGQEVNVRVHHNQCLFSNMQSVSRQSRGPEDGDGRSLRPMISRDADH